MSNGGKQRCDGISLLQLEILSLVVVEGRLKGHRRRGGGRGGVLGLGLPRNSKLNITTLTSWLLRLREFPRVAAYVTLVEIQEGQTMCFKYALDFGYSYA